LPETALAERTSPRWPTVTSTITVPDAPDADLG
jgi:hypothetical protein